jgi:hypothetical protein
MEQREIQLADCSGQQAAIRDQRTEERILLWERLFRPELVEGQPRSFALKDFYD